VKNRLKPQSLTCINISERELSANIPAAQKLGIHIDFRLMDAHKLEFPDQTFDLVYGLAILHHLNFEQAVREIWRVLKPGGRILFLEPLRLNPVAQIVRLLTPKARTVDERPLGLDELKIVKRYFHVEHHYSELTHVP